MKSARKLIETLKTVMIEDQREYTALETKVERALARLNAAWSNPAIAEDADVTKCDLLDAWYAATHRTRGAADATR